MREKGMGERSTFSNSSELWEKEGIRNRGENQIPESSLNSQPWVPSLKRLQRVALETPR